MAQKALSFLIFLCGLSRAGDQSMPIIHPNSPTLSREYYSKRSKQWAWTQDFPCLPLLTHRLNLLGPRVAKQLKIYIQSLAFWLIIARRSCDLEFLQTKKYSKHQLIFWNSGWTGRSACLAILLVLLALGLACAINLPLFIHYYTGCPLSNSKHLPV